MQYAWAGVSVKEEGLMMMARWKSSFARAEAQSLLTIRLAGIEQSG